MQSEKCQRPCCRIGWGARRWTGKAGFTAIELLTVLGIMSLLAAIVFGMVHRAQDSASRASCDARIAQITLALDNYKQENGHHPPTLAELVTRHYLPSADYLRCPDDSSTSDGYTDNGYSDYYTIREPRDSSQLPIIVCPFHEQSGHGVEGFVGHFTQENSVRPAQILTVAAGTLVYEPGKQAVVPVPGMLLHGGDRVITAAATGTEIRFDDGTAAELPSNCQLGANTDVMLMQSYAQPQSTSVYTLIRQGLGSVSYFVHHGSKFDVATPTATAGALGTTFTVSVTSPSISVPDPNSPEPTDTNAYLTVSDGIVAYSTVLETVDIVAGQSVNLGNITDYQRTPRGDGGFVVPVATPVPTVTPAPKRTPAPPAS